MKAVILARVSDPEQEDNYSTPAQVRRLTEYAQSKGLEVIEAYEVTESSTKDVRTKFETIIKHIKEAKEPIALVVDTIDRLQRGFRESIELDDMRKAGQLEIHFLREGLVLSKDSNSSDLLRWDMGVMFARSYVLQLSDNVKRATEQKLKNGEWSGKAPCGYINVRDENDKAWVEVDEERAPLVKKAFEWYATGNYSLKALAKILADDGLTVNSKMQKPMYTSYLEATIISNRFYYGEMEWKGKIYPHKYERLVPKWLWEKCQDVKASYGKTPFNYGAKQYAFKRLLKCPECNCHLSTYTQKNINYVRCHSCNAIHIKEETLLKQAAKLFEKLTMPEAVVEDLTSQLKALYQGEQEYYEENVERINGKLKKLRKRMKTMYEDRLDGRITPDEYDKLIEESKGKEAKFLEELQAHSEADKTFVISCSYILELAKRAKELFVRSQPEQKNKLLRFVLANATVKDGKLVPELKTPFQGILDCNKSKKWYPRRDSNPQPPVPKTGALSS